MRAYRFHSTFRIQRLCCSTLTAIYWGFSSAVQKYSSDWTKVFLRDKKNRALK